MLQRLVPLLTELAHMGGSESSEDLKRIVVYIAITMREPERWHRFAEAVRRQVPGGGALMNKTDEMIDIYGARRQREGRQEGELRGKVQTIDGLVRRDVPWSVIEAATGIDETTFDRLKHQLDAADGGTTTHAN